MVIFDHHTDLYGRNDMQHVDEGQCGLCTHFGESHPNEEKLVRIRTTHEAPETFVAEIEAAFADYR